jgi:hypothetical protein
MKTYLLFFSFIFISFLALAQNDKLTGEIDHDAQLQKYKVTNLAINSYDSDFGASYYGDDIVFASARKDKSNTNKKWKGNNQRFLNFYLGKANEAGEIYSYQSLKGESNSRYHESNAVFSKDLKTVYFTRNNYY